MKVSSKAEGAEYAIRDIVLAARRVEESGMQVDYLNIGDPVQFGFHPPDNVKQAYIDAISRGENHYAPSEGLADLREEIAKKESAKGLSVSSDSIIVTNGVSEAMDMVMATILEDGDEILLPGPHYPPYASYIQLHGGIPVEFSVDMNTSMPDLDDIKSKITPKTVAICMITPNNPTGTVFSRQSLKDLVDLANQHGLYIICDEIYDKIVFDEEFSGIGRVASDSPVILLNGFSKSHLMSGWRLGYIAFNQSPGLEEIRRNLPKLARIRIACNHPVQHAALESLRGPQQYINDFVSEVKNRRDIVVRRLNAMPGILCSIPRGAFYAFPKIEDVNDRFGTDKDFVIKLLESKGVLGVQGTGFGQQYGSGHFRLVFLPAPDVLNSALDKIEEFVS